MRGILSGLLRTDWAVSMCVTEIRTQIQLIVYFFFRKCFLNDCQDYPPWGGLKKRYHVADILGYNYAACQTPLLLVTV